MHLSLCVVGGNIRGDINIHTFWCITERIKHTGSHGAETGKPQPGMHSGGGCSRIIMLRRGRHGELLVQGENQDS